MFPSKNKKTGIWHIYYTNPKTDKRTKISTRTKNIVKANQFFSEFKKKYEQKQEGIKSITVKELTEIFTSYKINYVSMASIITYQKELKAFDGFLNNKLKVNEIKQEYIDNYSNYLFNQKYKPQTIKQKLNILYSAFRFAKKNKYTDIDFEPNKITIPNIEKRFLKENELLKLLSNTNNHDLQDIIMVAYMTGMRIGEIVNLRWDQVSMEQKVFYLNNTTHITKNRKIRTIPLNTEALAIIQRRFITKSSNYVFTHYEKEKWNIATLKEYFRLLTIKTFGKGSGISFHTLRHSFASNLVIDNVPIYTVSKLLGHSSITTTQIYSHLQTNNLQDIVEKLNINIKKEKVFNNN